METQTREPSVAEQQGYNRELRAYNDATTWLAETLDGRMLTDFEYTFDENENELYADDGGALGPIFEKAIDDAEELASKNPNLSFELRRRQIEEDEYQDMLKMASGDLPNTMIVVSDFPPELMDATEDVGGYNSSRKPTMLRVIIRPPEGNTKMYSQSLDGSNREALEGIYEVFGIKPESGELLGQRIHEEMDEVEQEFLVDKLTGVYDRNLEVQTGREHRAGRPLPEKHSLETHQFVRSQPDLVGYLTEKMLNDRLSKKVMFSVAATMAKRYENACFVGSSSEGQALRQEVNPAVLAQSLVREMHQATNEARLAGRTFSGCGASISAELDTEGQLKADGFGNKTSEKDSWHGGRVKKGKCVNCKEETKVGVENWCKNCISGHCGTK
jgi:hypothetical protein